MWEVAGGGSGAAAGEGDWEEFLAWEKWDWEKEWEKEGRSGTGMGCRYVGINKEVRALDTGVHENKGFARRPQEFLGWEVGGRM